MLIETSTPLRVRYSKGEFRLTPGHPVDLPEAQALKLLAKAGIKVRMVARPDSLMLKPGVEVAWLSPLSGESHGHVAMPPEEGWLVVQTHSAPSKLVPIHLDWGVRVIQRNGHDE